MQKIPTIFVRNLGTRLVENAVTAGCEWVIAGEGIATRKWDGTCMAVINGRPYRRYDLRQDKKAPEDFLPAQDAADPITGHWPGWAPLKRNREAKIDPADRWHWEGFKEGTAIIDGTYELCGPKINNNPEGFETHVMILHGVVTLPDAPRTFDELREYLELPQATSPSGHRVRIEGIVWHHSDGRMGKIKGKDFGIPRALPLEYNFPGGEAA
ncbi:MAG: hypothetical protein A2W26_07415 [Acidobacteria bacterium RBG_16_64_8]|nr:MAG: hypothetical protein A2W26_07415 [Acidobacteria bacterium RBG_16_64_8]